MMNNTIATVLEDWDNSMARGKIPYFEFELANDDYLLVHLHFDPNGVEFSFDSDGKPCYFDGDVVTIHENRYKLEWCNMEDWSLDSILEYISENINQGYICANNLYPNEEE